MTRGRCGSLALHRTTLAFATPRRFSPAHKEVRQMKPNVIEWDGTHISQALRELPAGRYAVEPIDNLPPLRLEEDAGIVTVRNQLDTRSGTALADSNPEFLSTAS